ncbi:hypothetical protein DRO32_01590 [Candidatus Bathyarchaeota archaeon]|nr:MAG: hypothetical protein DRO32_01590 [Candidatus Bathyarchaeota archaeon]
MGLKPFLLDGEKVISECRVGKSTFYITNLRLIKREEKGIIFKRTVIHDLSFSGIHGISLEVVRGDPWAVALGLFLLAIAIFVLATTPPEEIAGMGFLPLLVIEVMVGTGALGLGLLHRRSYFQLRGPSITGRREEAIWRISETTRVDVVEFVKTLREQLKKEAWAPGSRASWT